MAWTKLADLFQDNKPTRAVHLENQFNNIFLRDFSDCSSYANRLKYLADQLANVGAKVSDNRMVLRLIGDLTEAYGTLVTVIQNTTPLPSFAKAKSMLLLDETNQKQLAKQEFQTESALVTSTPPTTHSPSQNNDNSPNNNNYNRERGGYIRNRGGNNGRQNNQQQRLISPSNSQYRGPPSPFWAYPQWPTWVLHWPPPPYPYPSTSWPQRPPLARQQGILGSCPPAPTTSSFYSSPTPHSDSQYSPTDIENALYTLTLNPLDDN